MLQLNFKYMTTMNRKQYTTIFNFCFNLQHRKVSFTSITGIVAEDV